MLFIESRTADLEIEKSLRTPILEALQERGLVPLIRSSRLHFFEQALSGAERVSELERAVAEWSDSEGGEPYVRGDVFCFDDFAHYLVFGGEFDGGAGLRAGIIYDAQTDEPSAKLEAFCRNVEEAYQGATRGAGGSSPQGSSASQINGGGARATRIEWRARGAQTDDGGKSSADEKSADTQRGAVAPERARAVEILEDADARSFLQNLSEAHADGRVAEMLASGAGGAERDALVARLAGAGLVRREVQVSCRKDGRSLFRLPSPDALAIVTASNAVCSECGAAVADERAEELITPTPLVSAMLRDGAWLVSSLRSILAGVGIPEKETFIRQPAADGEAQLVANVSGEPFLFVLRDGDFAAAHARRAFEAESDARASHLVVIATGKIQDDARARLREQARRRSRAGGETEVILVEGLDAAPDELRRAVERVSRDALARELYELDTNAGFNVGYAIAVRFRLAQRKGALQDLAASAAGALAGSLREI